MTHRNSGTTTVALREELTRCLQYAHEHAADERACEALERGRRVLNALSFTAGDYAVLDNRLRNALRYVRRKERGPARFELRLLLRALDSES